MLGGLDGAQREGERHDEDAQAEDRGSDDGQAVEVLLPDTRTGRGAVHGGGDHVGDAGALAGVHEHEDDGEDAGDGPDDEKQDVENAHGRLLLVRIDTNSAKA